MSADYYRGCCSWSWFFPYHYPPVATDIAAALPTHKPAEFRLAAPLSPLEQLMGVFPAASAHCLPAVCRELMESPSSPIVDFYPVDFALDPNGARMKWQWIALLPFIVEDRLSAAVEQSVLPHLTPLEKKRNELSDRGLLFANSETQLGRLLASVSAETALGKGVQLSGRVGGTAASKEVPSGVTLSTFAPSLAADRRKAGLQPGAEPPPSTLDGFAPSGPRPRMTLADLRPMRGGGAPDRRDDGRARGEDRLVSRSVAHHIGALSRLDGRGYHSQQSHRGHDARRGDGPRRDDRDRYRERPRGRSRSPERGRNRPRERHGRERHRGGETTRTHTRFRSRSRSPDRRQQAARSHKRFRSRSRSRSRSPRRRRRR